MEWMNPSCCFESVPQYSVLLQGAFRLPLQGLERGPVPKGELSDSAVLPVQLSAH